jgi:hypothetical protein
MLIIIPSPKYEMAMTPTTYYSSMSLVFSHLWALLNCDTISLRIRNLTDIGFGSTQKCDQGIGNVIIVESPQQGESANVTIGIKHPQAPTPLHFKDWFLS